MPFIDVRSIPQIAAIQQAFNAVLNRANVSVANLEQQIVQKVAEFYATPTRVQQFATRIDYVRGKAMARKNADAVSRLLSLQMKNGELQSQYESAKPTVNAAVEQVQGANTSVTSKLVGSAANAGLLMASVFSATKAQDAAIAAVEKGVLTPAEAAELFKKLQAPTDSKNVVLFVGIGIMLWLVLRRR